MIRHGGCYGSSAKDDGEVPVTIADLLQSDATLFAVAVLGIAISSVAIVRDYLPRGEAPRLSVGQPIVRDRAA